MAKIDQTRAPYNNDYDARKHYTQILANPGRVAQAREFNQIQTMFLDFLGRGLNVFLADGDIISGCNITIKGKAVTIEAGKIYVNGIVHEVPESSVTIRGIGQETIGVTVQETIITAENDNTLLDPAVGQRNFLQPGADRLRQDISYVVNEDTAVIVFRLVDGNLKNQTEKPQLDVMTDILARRTYEESGNYKINGLTMYPEDYPGDTNKILINVDRGKAYVEGYEVTKPVTSRVFLDKSTDVRSVMSEPSTYYTTLNKYPLRNIPVKQVNRLVATVQVTETIKRGNIVGGSDLLPKQPLVEVLEVKQLNNTYQSGRDYQVVQDGISWLPSTADSTEPERGASYTVTWQYNKPMIEGTDYELVAQNGEYFIRFLANGDKPVNGKLFNVDYDYFLARIDSIYLDKNGDFIVMKGQADIDSRVQPPVVTSSELLPLAYVKLAPNSKDVGITERSIKRTSMEDLQNVIKRVEDIEYNQAIDDLDNEAASGESASLLRGIFSEGFLGTTRGDLAYKVGGVAYNTALNILKGEMLLPMETTPYDLTVDAANSSVSNPMNLSASNARLVMAKFTEVIAMEQPNATDRMLVNPYQVYARMGQAVLTPAVDNWVETDNIIVEKTQSVLQMFIPWWGGTDSTVTTVTRSSQVILDEAILFMRSRVIRLSLSGFYPNSDNVTCSFDGQKMTLSPILGTLRGTNAGTLKADAKGEAYGEFTIPSGIRTGTKEVVAYNDLASASTTYTSTGRHRVVQETVFRTITTTQWYDPLAQSFSFREDRLLTSVGLYFATKDPSIPVTVQIRRMINGFPGNEILAEKVLQPSQVAVSEKGTTETKVTFTDPCYLGSTDQYAVILLTTSPLYSMFIAELGKTDLATGKVVTNQPYEAGVLFSSSNAQTWTAHQKQDLKCRIYTASFDTLKKHPITFNKVPVTDVDAYINFVEALIPNGTKIDWEVKLEWKAQSGDSGWIPTYLYAQIDTSLLVRSIQLRGTLSVTPFISPTIALDSANIIAASTQKTATYISRMVTLARPATVIKQSIELSIPSGTYGKVYFTLDGVTWHPATQTGFEVVDQEFARYTHETNVTSLSPGGSQQFAVRVDLSTDDQTLRARARKFLNIMK